MKPVVTTIASFIVAARDFGERVSVSLQRYYFSEQQSGKDVCDRILCPLKGAVRRYCNEGHDVLTASDMHKALKKRPVQECTAAVCHVNGTKKDLDIKKLQQFSAIHDFSYQQDGLRVWKTYQVDTVKLIQWDEIYIKHRGATDLITEQEKVELFAFQRKKGSISPPSLKLVNNLEGERN